MTSYGASAGTDVHPFVADRAEDWFAGEPVFFLPGCKITPQEAHLLLFWGFFIFCLLCACPPAFWSTANFLSFTCKFCYVFSSLCVAVFSYQRASYTALPFLWDSSSLLTDFYPLFLPSISVWLQAVLSLRKEKPDTARPKAWDVSDLTVMPVSQTSMISLLEYLETEDFYLAESVIQVITALFMLLHLLPVMHLDCSLILCSSNKRKR